MNDFNVQYIALGVTTGVIKVLKSESETTDLESLTNAHSRAWVKGVRQVIATLEDAIKIAEETDYDKLHL